LNVRVDPGGHRLACTAAVHYPPEARFFLNNDFLVKQVLADGCPVSFRRDPAQTLLSDAATAVIVETSTVPKELRVEYAGAMQEGALPKMLEVVSMIREELVELAFYAVWHPRFQDGGPVSFSLDAHLPAGYRVVTNGLLQSEETFLDESGQEWVRSCWVSAAPGFDIVLLAAPGLERTSVSRDGSEVEIYSSRLPAGYVQAMGERLLTAMRRFAGLYGELPSQIPVRLIYAPRDAWGYARAPAIIVADGGALARLDDPEAWVVEFHYNAHELAHFWWGIASMATPDDWINEGLAEFSAYRIVEEIFGPEAAGKRADTYRQHAAACKTETPIAETTSDSPDREVNRYDKVALLMISARERFGSAALDRFLRALYGRFSITTDATTAGFLEELEKQLGPDAKAFFAQALYSKTWSGLIPGA
jgi:hypothetical protein